MMNSIQLLEEDIYLPIVKQFEEETIDIELVGKTIVKVFKDISRERLDDDQVSKPELERNTLYLVSGLLHKDRPIGEFGEELWCKKPNEIDQIIDDFKFTFLE